MTFLQRLTKKLSGKETSTKTDDYEEDTGDWFVFRYKEGRWTRFGKGYAKEYMAFNAMVDWQALFPQLEFKTGKDTPHACQECH